MTALCVGMTFTHRACLQGDTAVCQGAGAGKRSSRWSSMMRSTALS